MTSLPLNYVASLHSAPLSMWHQKLSRKQSIPSNTCLHLMGRFCGVRECVKSPQQWKSKRKHPGVALAKLCLKNVYVIFKLLFQVRPSVRVCVQGRIIRSYFCVRLSSQFFGQLDNVLTNTQSLFCIKDQRRRINSL